MTLASDRYSTLVLAVYIYHYTQFVACSLVLLDLTNTMDTMLLITFW